MRSPRIDRKRTGGFALVETVGLITVIGMLLSLSAVVMNQAYKAHQEALMHVRHTQQVQVLAARFRADAEAAVDVTVTEELLLTMLGGRQIRYRTSEDRVHRVTSDGEAEIGREVWQLPARVDAKWTLDESGRIPLIVWDLHFGTDQRGVDPVRWVARTNIQETEHAAD